jgi:hypothetical protein
MLRGIVEYSAQLLGDKTVIKLLKMLSIQLAACDFACSSDFLGKRGVKEMVLMTDEGVKIGKVTLLIGGARW